MRRMQGCPHHVSRNRRSYPKSVPDRATPGSSSSTPTDMERGRSAENPPQLHSGRPHRADSSQDTGTAKTSESQTINSLRQEGCSQPKDTLAATKQERPSNRDYCKYHHCFARAFLCRSTPLPRSKSAGTASTAHSSQSPNAGLTSDPTTNGDLHTQ